MRLHDLRDYPGRVMGSKYMGMSLFLEKSKFEKLKDVSDYIVKQKGKDLWYTNAFYPTEVRKSYRDEIFKKPQMIEIALFYNPFLQTKH